MSPLPEITSRAAAVVPPIVLLHAPVSIRMPSAVFGSAKVPVASVPMNEPETVLNCVVAPVMTTPVPVLPEITSLLTTSC